MEQQIDNGELTFKKLGQKLKRSWVRMVVWAVVLLVFACTTMGLYAAFTTDYNFDAKIMFSNEYINKGMSPWDNTFNPSADIKSNYVVQQALAKIGLSEDEQITMVSKVISNLSVTADSVESKDKEQNKTENAKQFTFTVTLQNQNSLGLSRAKTQELLDEICRTYMTQYKAKYSYQNYISFSSEVAKQNNYIVTSKLLESNLEQLANGVAQMKSVAPTFRSTKYKITFDNLAEEIKSAQVYFINLNAYLTENGVETSNTNVPTEMAYLEQTKLELDSKVKYYDGIIKGIQDNADKLTGAFNSMSAIGTNNGIVVNIDKLVEYYKEITRYEELKAPYQVQLDSINKIIAGYGSSSKFATASDEKKAEMRKVTDDMIAMISENIETRSNMYSEMLAEFNDVENLKKAIVLTQSATRYSQLKISGTLFALIALMTVLVGCVIGVARTDHKIKKYNLAMEAKSAPSIEGSEQTAGSRADDSQAE